MIEDAEKSLAEIAKNLTSGMGFEMVDVRIKMGRTPVLSVTIDKPGGVSAKDCADFSVLLEQVLKRESFAENYTLEVMSPGIRRPLKKQDDFKRSIGKRIIVKLEQPFEGRKTFRGFLREAQESTFKIESGGEIFEFEYENISGARLDPELPW